MLLDLARGGPGETFRQYEAEDLGQVGGIGFALAGKLAASAFNGRCADLFDEPGQGSTIPFGFEDDVHGGLLIGR